MKTLNVLLGVVVVVALAAPTFPDDGGANRLGTSLSGIGKAMMIYANDYEDELPRAGGRNSTWTPSVWWTTPDRFTTRGGQPSTSSGSAPGEYPTTELRLTPKPANGRDSLCIGVMSLTPSSAVEAIVPAPAVQVALEPFDPSLGIRPYPTEPPQLDAPEVHGTVSAGLTNPGGCGNYISIYFVCDARPGYELGHVRIDFTATNVKIDSLSSMCIPEDDRIVNKTKVGDQILELDFQGFTSDEEVVLGLDLDLLSSGSGTPYGRTYEGGVVELSFVGPPEPGQNPVVATFAETGTFTAGASF